MKLYVKNFDTLLKMVRSSQVYSKQLGKALRSRNVEEDMIREDCTANKLNDKEFLDTVANLDIF